MRRDAVSGCFLNIVEPSIDGLSQIVGASNALTVVARGKQHV